MKKLILATAIVLGGLSTMNAQAQEETTTPAQTEQTAPTEATTTTEQTTTTATTTQAADEFTEIKVEEVPAAVTAALKTAYPEAILNKALVNAKKEYQLQVKVGDKEGAIYADENGKWIQK